MQEEYSKILWEAYHNFSIKLGNNQFPIPYRINIPFQPDRRRYGKSDSQELSKSLQEIATENNFNLDTAQQKEIMDFMRDQMLGIDCSGFVYHMLDYLLKKLDKGGMEAIGFPPASKTNVALLCDEQFSYPIELSEIQPGDLIALNFAGDIKHIVIVLGVNGTQIIYAHTSSQTTPKSVHTAQAIISKDGIVFKEKLGDITYNPEAGDGPRRLKALE